MSSTPTPLNELAPGVYSWSRWHEEKQLAFNGFFIEDAAGNVVIDPPELEPHLLDEIWSRGGLAAILITNGHHGRRSGELAQRTGAKVHAPAKDLALLHVPVDASYGDAALLPGGLRAIALKHSKTPGESALLLPRDGGTLFLGDALIGRPAGKLSLLPEEKIPNPARAAKGLAVLLEHEFERVLVADGEQPDGRHALEDFLVHAGVRPKKHRH